MSQSKLFTGMSSNFDKERRFRVGHAPCRRLCLSQKIDANALLPFHVTCNINQKKFARSTFCEVSLSSLYTFESYI
jgi:hypothetical protein